MPSENFEQLMDKQVKNKDFERFLVYFSQYLSLSLKQTPNIVFYKTIALLYYLANQEYEKYYALVQTCTKVEDFEYVMDVYDAINICDFIKLDQLHKEADSSYKVLIEQIILNVKKSIENDAMDKKRGIEEHNALEQKEKIKECLFILNKFKK